VGRLGEELLPRLHLSLADARQRHLHPRGLHTHGPACVPDALAASSSPQHGQEPGAGQEPDHGGDPELCQRDRLGQNRHAHTEQDVRDQLGGGPHRSHAKCGETRVSAD